MFGGIFIFPILIFISPLPKGFLSGPGIFTSTYSISQSASAFASTLPTTARSLSPPPNDRLVSSPVIGPFDPTNTSTVSEKSAGEYNFANVTDISNFYLPFLQSSEAVGQIWTRIVKVCLRFDGNLSFIFFCYFFSMLSVKVHLERNFYVKEQHAVIPPSLLAYRLKCIDEFGRVVLFKRFQVLIPWRHEIVCFRIDVFWKYIFVECLSSNIAGADRQQVL